MFVPKPTGQRRVNSDPAAAHEAFPSHYQPWIRMTMRLMTHVLVCRFALSILVLKNRSRFFLDVNVGVMSDGRSIPGCEFTGRKTGRGVVRCKRLEMNVRTEMRVRTDIRAMTLH